MQDETQPGGASAAADQAKPDPTEPDQARPVPSDLKRLRLRVVAIAVVAGGLALAGGTHLLRGQRDAALLPLRPIAVAALQPSDAVAVGGTVAEIFGNKFILQDASGRALVDTGPGGDDGALVAKGETLQAQGRFDRASLHAVLLTHADGRRVVLGPPGPPPPGADVALLTQRVQAAGYQDVRVVGRGPRHLDVVARAPDGRDRNLHVDVDGDIRARDVF